VMADEANTAGDEPGIHHRCDGRSAARRGVVNDTPIPW